MIAAISNSAAEGREMLEKHSDKLEGPDKVKLENSITVKEKSEKNQFDAQQAILTSANLVNTFDDDSPLIRARKEKEDDRISKATGAFQRVE